MMHLNCHTYWKILNRYYDDNYKKRKRKEKEKEKEKRERKKKKKREIYARGGLGEWWTVMITYPKLC